MVEPVCWRRLTTFICFSNASYVIIVFYFWVRLGHKTDFYSGAPMPIPPSIPKPPGAVGLYDPRYEHDACGVGFVADIKGRRSHGIVRKGLEILINLLH